MTSIDTDKMLEDARWHPADPPPPDGLKVIVRLKNGREATGWHDQCYSKPWRVQGPNMATATVTGWRLLPDVWRTGGNVVGLTAYTLRQRLISLADLAQEHVPAHLLSQWRKDNGVDE